MCDILKRFFRMILYNWSTLLCFELFYKTLGFALIAPLLQFILLKLPAVSGLTFLGQENIAVAFSNPKAIALLLLVLILAAAYVYFEFTALALYCDKSWRGGKVGLWTLWKDTFRCWARIFLPYNLPVFLLLLPALSLSVLPLTSGALNAVKVPEFILEFIRQKPVLSALYGILLLALNLAALFYLFGVPYAVLDKERFLRAWKKSRALLKGRMFKTMLILAFCFLLTALALLLVAAAGIFLIFYYVKITGGGEEAFRFLVASWGRTGRIAVSILGPTVLTAVSVLLYHRYRGEKPPAPTRAGLKARRIRKRLAVTACLVGLLLFLGETTMGGAWAVPNGKNTLIVAHRGGAVFAPENTVAALEQAILDDADMAEIDVQQTKDGVLIVMHDSNFKRTTGLDLNVWDADYSQVRGLDASRLASSRYKGEPIPTLHEMLRAAKGRIKLMIELKSNGHEINLVEQTVAAIRDEGMEDECVLASMDLSILRAARISGPQLENVYITAILLSKKYDLKYVDGYSVETTSLTPEMAARIHAQGKTLYVWTANSASNIRRILRSEADGLLTDNPALARYYLEAGSEDLFLDMLTQWLYH